MSQKERGCNETSRMTADEWRMKLLTPNLELLSFTIVVMVEKSNYLSRTKIMILKSFSYAKEKNNNFNLRSYFL